jgi:hypothetical protein
MRFLRSEFGRFEHGGDEARPHPNPLPQEREQGATACSRPGSAFLLSLSYRWELTENGLGGRGDFAGGVAKQDRGNGTNKTDGTNGGRPKRIKVVQGGIRVNQTKSNLLKKGRRQKDEGRMGPQPSHGLIERSESVRLSQTSQSGLSAYAK